MPTPFTNESIQWPNGLVLDGSSGSLTAATSTGASGQCWDLWQGGSGLFFLSPHANTGLAVDWLTLTLAATWDDASSPQNTWVQDATGVTPLMFLTAYNGTDWSGPYQMLQVNSSNAVVWGPLLTGFSLITPASGSGSGGGSPPVSGLQAIPVAMFSPANPNATDQYQETGSWEYWGTQLQKSGPVITMPLAVGVNPNYGGDAFGWADPSSIMVQDTNPAWMLSIGLNMPSGPTLTAAGTGAMDQDWGNAAGSARFGANYGHSTGSSLWDSAGMAQARSKLYCRFGWEETGSWYAWGAGSPGQVSTWNADFKAAFRRAVGIFRAECAQPDKNGNTCEVIVIFNPNGDYNTPAGINLDDHYPGDDVVDVMAIDIYDMPQYQGGFQADGVTPNLSAADRFAQFQLPNLQAIDAYAHAHDKAVGVCEWAAGDGGGDNPTFVNGVASWASTAASPVAVLGYWSGGSGSGYNGNIDLYPNQKAAFIANYGA